MPHKFHFHLPHYFSKHPSHGLRELYWSVGLMGLGIAMVTIFEPIFLYTQGYSLKHIMVFYLIVYGAYFVLLPIGGRIVSRLGYEHSIFYSQFFLISYYLLLFAIPKFDFFFYVAPIVFAFQKLLYWPAFHADFAHFSQGSQRGREVSGIESLTTSVYVVGPFVGGVILEWTNFSILFIVAASSFILSSIPLLRLHEVRDPAPFTYRGVLRDLLSREHRRNFLAYLGFGEELILMTAWPIFIFLVVQDYLQIGTLVALATLLTALTVLYIGRFSDRYPKNRLMQFGTLGYFVASVLRGFATKIWHVFAIDASSRLSREMYYVPLHIRTYGWAQRVNVLGYVVFFEQSIAVAKILAAALVLCILQFADRPFTPIFILGGFFSLCYLLLRNPGDVISSVRKPPPVAGA